ncbi:MAG: PilZ domain-containing protein [Myxococcaceae bacterium]
MSDNKRTKRRAPLDIYLNKYISGVPYMTRSSDISAEGLNLAHLIEPHHAGKRVGLQFQLPGTDEVIYAEGEVVREWVDSRANGSGVRFTLLTERHRKLIHSYIARHDEAFA